MSNLPDWTGADAVYAKANAILARMGRRGHATPAIMRRGRVVEPGVVSDEMRALIDALDRGEEETIKGLLLQMHVYQ